ncbi:phospholipid-transporting ATPase IF-like [Physella acuta]|uniref:phospholipid-transporting ATPase IF-like n=1 Tax=Physella acuta TaxID=109671 RepID=UPI0027DB9F44|nr:phospholipid-transporting ATPase IF-like [Physella acuta]
MAEGPARLSAYERFGSALIPQKLRKRLFSRHRQNEDRVVYVDNRALPGDGITEEIKYPSNTVVSSKYTIITFLPKNLFEQLRRVANFYFLCVAVIQFVIDTPVTPLTSILPLVFVLAVTAIKQGYEDWLRHRADNEVNLRPASIIRSGKQQPDVRAMDIKVGDIVKVSMNEEFPCDLVLLSSHDPQGQCFVTTANLDGETNLKTLYCLNETRGYATPEELFNLRAKIKCKAPIADLYTFEGVMDFGSEAEAKPLNPENLLLRGARLKNTEYIYGCAVYTGRDTKMALNSKFKKAKFSRVERKMNAFLLVFLVILLVESVVSAGLKFWFEDVHVYPWYVDKEQVSNKAKDAVETALAFMVLYNYVIPISLYVTVELQKFLGSLFFGWDVLMYDPTIDEPAKAITSDLNEELGQVEFLFTDKTGTLTENTMAFRQCCIGKRQFEEINGRLYERKEEQTDLKNEVQFSPDMDTFFKVLALCHTVRIDRHHTAAGTSSSYSPTGAEYVYQASSPDEKALVEACARFGVVYHGMKDDMMEVTFHKKMKHFKLLHTLPFDPTRKRMSVIIEDDNGEIILMCKGADMAIIDRAVYGDIPETQKYIDEYAVLGLRTLSIAVRKLSQQDYKHYDQLLCEAKRSLVKRTEMLSELYNEMEDKLTLLGATAVEDKLQADVPQTIEALRLAGIKVWVLTGDKEETAVNISHSAGHFNTSMTELRLTQVASEEQYEAQITILLNNTTLSEPDVEYALIIDGKSLVFAFQKNVDWLRELCLKCVAVLCCRMSPLQKAQIVQMIKKCKSRPVTAAIGDGANDVSMIQEADVGFGIMGKEGRQAVRNSDYAFGKFKFLRRALLFHGHLYYHRIATLVQYFFYKNVAWITGQLFYAIFNAWSEQTLYDPFYLVFYNLCFTSLPILIFGIFEQHKAQDELLNRPALYRNVTRNAKLSWPQFIKWNMLGLWHCCVFFFVAYFLQWKGVPVFSAGEALGNYDFGTLIYFSCVASVNIKLMLETYYWCLPTFISYIITFLGIILLVAVYTNVFWPSFISSTNDLYRALAQIYSCPVTWLAMFLMIVLALLPDYILRVVNDIKATKSSNKSARHFHKQNRISSANGQAQVGSTSARRPQEVDFTSNQTYGQEIELQSSPNGFNKKLTGYVNPALSLSSENLSAPAPPTNTHHTSNGHAIKMKDPHRNNSAPVISREKDSETVFTISLPTQDLTVKQEDISHNLPTPEHVPSNGGVAKQTTHSPKHDRTHSPKQFKKPQPSPATKKKSRVLEVVLDDSYPDVIATNYKKIDSDHSDTVSVTRLSPSQISVPVLEEESSSDRNKLSVPQVSVSVPEEETESYNYKL